MPEYRRFSRTRPRERYKDGAISAFERGQSQPRAVLAARPRVGVEPAIGPLLEATRTVSIVFVIVPDPAPASTDTARGQRIREPV